MIVQDHRLDFVHPLSIEKGFLGVIAGQELCCLLPFLIPQRLIKLQRVMLRMQATSFLLKLLQLARPWIALVRKP